MRWRMHFCDARRHGGDPTQAKSKFRKLYLEIRYNPKLLGNKKLHLRYTVLSSYLCNLYWK